jgi:hypothetical protein
MESKRGNAIAAKARQMEGPGMNPDDFPAPTEGFVLTHFLVVSDQDRSREFYKKIFDGTVLIERDPVIMKVANSWLILNEGGGPTDDNAARPQPHERLPQHPGGRHPEGLQGVVSQRCDVPHRAESP